MDRGSKYALSRRSLAMSGVGVYVSGKLENHWNEKGEMTNFAWMVFTEKSIKPSLKK
jgi:hypothetical protein